MHQIAADPVRLLRPHAQEMSRRATPYMYGCIGMSSHTYVRAGAHADWEKACTCQNIKLLIPPDTCCMYMLPTVPYSM